MRALGLPCLLALFLHAFPALAAPAQGEMERLTHDCGLCHGADGNSVSSLYPRLAGQPAGYLEGQLRAFRDHRRADRAAQAFMWGMASQLSDDAILRLAAYYSRQSPRAALAPTPAETALGQQIFSQGLPAQGVPACQTCHGSAAQGAGAVPRLAGQHPGYLERQLEQFRSGLRDTDPGMPATAAGLSPAQQRAVTRYLGALPGGAPAGAQVSNP